MCLEVHFWATSELRHVAYDFADTKCIKKNSNKSSEKVN
jgi:hypothetical protein